MRHISRTGYTFYLRPRREIVLRFTRTRCCNTREITCEANDVKQTDSKKYLIRARQKRQLREINRRLRRSNNSKV